MSYQRAKAYNFGPAYVGQLSHAGYALEGDTAWSPAVEVLDPDSNPTGGVRATVDFPDDYQGLLLWCPDTTATPRRFAFVEINDGRIDLEQPLRDVRTATVGGAFHGSWAAAFGKMILDRATRTLQLFGFGSQSAPLATFNLNDGSTPTTRTPS